MLTGSAFGVASFGVMPDGTPVESFRLTNSSGMEVCFLSLGGIITSIKVPDRNGMLADVTPGYDDLLSYLEDRNYFGALIGRYANRIADGHFMLGERAYSLPTNDGDNTLHGGDERFHRVVWHVEPVEAPGELGALLSHVSPAGTAGFPGTLHVRVTYTLTDDNEIVFDYRVTTDEATPVNLSQHFYLNLGGHDAGDVLGHTLQLHASHYLPVDEELIPTRRIDSVAGTPFDFRVPRAIGEAMRSGPVPEAGFDNTFVLDEGGVAARLVDPVSGRVVEIDTTEPGIQFYSGGMIAAATPGKGGVSYNQFTGVALEAQHFPDSPNIPSFPDTILRPGEELSSRTVYRFGVIG